MLLSFISFALADPLFGTLDLAAPRELIVQPGVEFFPISGAGGSMTPELTLDASGPGGLDVRLAAGLAVPLYALDDAVTVLAPYNQPELAFVDVVGRWARRGGDPVHPNDRFYAGIRVSNRPFDHRGFGAGELGFGPEVGWSHQAGPVVLVFRPSFLTQPGWWPDGFGYLDLSAAIALPLPGVEFFVDATPKAWLMMGSRGNSGPEFMPELSLDARLGARIQVKPRHEALISAGWSPDSHLHPEENLSAWLGYHGRFGG